MFSSLFLPGPIRLPPLKLKPPSPTITCQTSPSPSCCCANKPRAESAANAIDAFLPPTPSVTLSFKSANAKRRRTILNLEVVSFNPNLGQVSIVSMVSRKLVRDVVFLGQPLFVHLRSKQQPLHSIFRAIPTNWGYLGDRRFSVLNEFSNKVKGEAIRSQEFQQSVKELKRKAEELKGVKEDLKIRTKQTTEQIYKQVDGAWTEAEATAKKVSASMKEKISAAREEVKEHLGVGNREHTESSYSDSAKHEANMKGGRSGASSSAEEEKSESVSDHKSETIFGKFKTSAFSASPKVSTAFGRLKEVKVIDLAKKGYDILKNELNGSPTKRKHMGHAPPPPKAAGETSTRTDIVLMPSKQSSWSKKWEALKDKMRGYPMFKRVSNMSDTVVSKAQDVKEELELIDHPVVNKIQDLNESLFQETDAALSTKEICRRDPSFSLPEFVEEIQGIVKPVLNAYIKGDAEALKVYCCKEVIERCKAEHAAYQGHGIFFDDKILHVSEVEVRETKMMGTSPIIIVNFRTQQVHCVRDRNGAITEGGKDTIHTVYYAWAMQQIEPEELGEGAIDHAWKLREMQQIGVQALI